MCYNVRRRIADRRPAAPERGTKGADMQDSRFEDIARETSELAADYVADVLVASNRFLDTLLRDVAALTRDVIEEAEHVVTAACNVFLPERRA